MTEQEYLKQALIQLTEEHDSMFFDAYGEPCEYYEPPEWEVRERIKLLKEQE